MLEDECLSCTNVECYFFYFGKYNLIKIKCVWFYMLKTDFELDDFGKN